MMSSSWTRSHLAELRARAISAEYHAQQEARLLQMEFDECFLKAQIAARAAELKSMEYEYVIDIVPPRPPLPTMLKFGGFHSATRPLLQPMLISGGFDYTFIMDDEPPPRPPLPDPRTLRNYYAMFEMPNYDCDCTLMDDANSVTASRDAWWENDEPNPLPNHDTLFASDVPTAEFREVVQESSSSADESVMSSSTACSEYSSSTPESQNYYPTMDATGDCESAAGATEFDLQPDFTPAPEWPTTTSAAADDLYFCPTNVKVANAVPPERPTRADLQPELPQPATANANPPDERLQPPVIEVATPKFDESELQSISIATRCLCAVILACATAHAVCRVLTAVAKPVKVHTTASTSVQLNGIGWQTLNYDTNADAVLVLVSEQTDDFLLPIGFMKSAFRNRMPDIDIVLQTKLSASELRRRRVPSPRTDRSFPFDPGP